jgi:hypothetical protein
MHRIRVGEVLVTALRLGPEVRIEQLRREEGHLREVPE